MTVSIKLCVAFDPTPLLAVMVTGNEPEAPVGVPLRIPALLSVTPLGKAPVSEKVADGDPLAVTVNEPGEPTVKVVLLALVMLGAVPVASPVTVIDGEPFCALSASVTLSLSEPAFCGSNSIPTLHVPLIAIVLDDVQADETPLPALKSAG